MVKIYGYNTGTSFNVSPADYHSYNPVMRGDSVIYFVNKEKGGELELYQFATGKRTTLSWSNAQKLEPTVGFNF